MSAIVSKLGHALAICCVLTLTGGCFGGSSLESGAENAPDSGGAGGGGAPTGDPDDGAGFGEQCITASDCVLAASTCCECPSFAAPVGEGYDAGCDAVDCEAPSGLCPAVEATCDAGSCVMICSPIIADKTCTFGFARDEAGCLTNDCATPASEVAQCELDTDCVEIPADCCGCALGGKDQAASAAEANAILDGLACPTNPACPGVDTCDPSQVPRCITGSCVLSADIVDPQPNPSAAQLCGTPQLEVCPSGTLCVLNEESAKNASDLGVGSCSTF